MKQLRSKSLGTQLKVLRLAMDRVKKVHTEIRELSYRNWRGGEAQIASEVNAARDALYEATEKLILAESYLAGLESAAAARGK